MPSLYVVGERQSPAESLHDGCPVLTKDRVAQITKGECATISWSLRRNGLAVDLSAVSSADGDGDDTSESLSESAVAEGSAKVRFADADVVRTPVLQIDATIFDASNGELRFEVPSEIANLAGIYEMHLGVFDADENLVFSELGLLSVERSLWGDLQQGTGPPTLNEIRMLMRDTALENEALLDEVEFDPVEIVTAIVRPIQFWNEALPPVRRARASTRTFPYRDAWRKAIVAELLTTAVHNLSRNAMNVNHGGLQGNFNDRWKPYAIMAQALRQEWEQFVARTKVSINVKGGFGRLGSPYGGGRGWF